MARDHSPASVCELCRENTAFTLPQPLLDSLGEGSVVIFAGAGISTEGKPVFPYTLYDDVARELKVSPSSNLSFPDVMAKFCKQPNGRQKHLRKIRERFDYIKSFPEIYRTATRFHRELATMYQIDSIVTTNWDDYFEVECGAVPFVSAEDFAVWDLPGRKVFKIHGSINNLGSIVATTDDYQRCYDQLSTGLIGSVLKTMLATKTLVYVGYSFSDFDFVKIHEILTAEMKGMRPHSYVVTLDESAKQRFKDTDMTPIITGGSHFLAHLKNHVVVSHHMMPDNQFDGLGSIFDRIAQCHNEIARIDLGKYPAAILTACYQDGLLHALERIDARKNTGEYSHTCDIRGKIIKYDEIRKDCLRNKSYTDVAYIDGYQNGLLLLLATTSQRKHVPIYYIFGAKEQPCNLRDYKRMLSRSDVIHKSAFNVCRNLVRTRGLSTPGIVFHHTPFLL